MKKIYAYWTEGETDREGYSEADITYDFDCSDTGHYGETRQTLQEAIKDAKKYCKENKGVHVSINAHAILRELYCDGELADKPDEGHALIGTIFKGKFFDLCTQEPWL